jgi:hypothetical protein
MAGYSGTPLVKKLGIGEGFKILLINAPPEYRTWVSPLPAEVSFITAADSATNFVHAFATKRLELARLLPSLRRRLPHEALIWVSWPKKSSKVPTDVTENTIREVALPLGFVDVKVCAVTDVWSGLKLVVRKELREKARDAMGHGGHR